METDITLSAENRERLERYLSRCERKLDHLSPSDRSSVIAELREYLLKGDDSELGKRLLQNRDVVALINPFLINKGLPLIRTKKRGIFLYVLLIIFILIATMIYKTVSFIGDFVGNIDFTENAISSGDFKISFSTDYDGGYNLKGLGLEQEGSVDKSEFSSITMKMEQSVINIESSGTAFTFLCNTNDASYSPIRLVEKKLYFELKGQNKCKITVPEGVSFNSEIDQGVLTLKNMGQSFSVAAKRATVFWSEARPEQFSLTKKVNGIDMVNSDFSVSGPYKVNIDVDKGILKIKKFQIR